MTPLVWANFSLTHAVLGWDADEKLLTAAGA
jgi:hypothetical protein